ncbi:MAG: hypothetical protein KAY96_00785 [Bacteroidia bacterium]|nr:hypothetical protein [Bacteroidia bacterium]
MLQRVDQGDIRSIDRFGNCILSHGKEDALLLEYYDLKKRYFFKSHQLDSVSRYIDLSMEVAQRCNDARKVISIQFEIGLLYAKQKKSVEAIQQFQALLPEIETGNDTVLLGKLYHNLSTVYIELYQFEAGMEYLCRALDVIVPTKDFHTQGKIWMQLADLQMQLYRFDTAEVSASKARRAFEKVAIKDYQGSAAIREAVCRIKQGKQLHPDTLLSLLAFLPALQNGPSGKVTKTTAYVGLAQLLIYNKFDLPQAEELLAHSLPTCDSMQLRLNITDIYYAYAQLNKLNDAPDSAYAYYERYARLKEEIAQEGSRLQLNGLRVLHQVDQQAEQIKNLEQERQISHLWTVILAISVGFAIFIAVFLSFVLRQKLRLATKRHQIQQLTLENQRLLNEKLEAENVSNARELATTTLHIIQKNEVLERLNAEISPLLKESELSSQIKLQLQSLRGSIRDNDFWETTWENFRQHFDRIHPEFFQNLQAQFPRLTPNDLRHCAYVRMNLTRKEIALLLNVNVEAVKMARNRLKKKMNLTAEEDLIAYILRL